MSCNAISIFLVILVMKTILTNGLRGKYALRRMRRARSLR
jgi:hypothetical protein